MRKAKKVSLPEMPVQESLTELERMQMALNTALVAEAKVRLEMAVRGVAQAAVAGELQAHRLEAQTNRNLATAKRIEEDAKAKHDEVTERAKNVAADIAAKYAVDWRSASYDPETGAIIRLPGET